MKGSDKMAIGDRMKSQYENRTDYMLPRRTYTVLRVDGRSFHTLTKELVRPFDPMFMAMMDNTAIALCEEIAGAQFAYVQSDEISVLITDFSTITTDAWFDGSLRKLCSVGASLATANFAKQWWDEGHKSVPTFDARAFTIPDQYEVSNYFIWRQMDWTRNSIQMVARSHYSQKELHGKNTLLLQDMIHEKKDNWAKYPDRARLGMFIIKDQSAGWTIKVPPIFTKNRDFLIDKIPVLFWQGRN